MGEYDFLDIINNDNDYIIQLHKVTKIYPRTSAGVFDINIKINKGEVYGFIGPNGAGKTTTIRQLIGFIKPDDGSVTINGHNVWNNTKQLMHLVGYLPGEIILPEYMKGIDYLKACAAIRNNVDWAYVKKLIKYFEFNPEVKIKKMSRGMKQKMALIATFMHKPTILILDEPTSGLDPLMQDKLLKIIANYKSEGATIFFSSHIFSEIEKLADKIAIIKSGRIVSEVLMKDLNQTAEKTYLLKFINHSGLDQFSKLTWKFELIDNKAIKVFIDKNEINRFFKDIAELGIDSCTEQKFTLDEHFLKFYGERSND